MSRTTAAIVLLLLAAPAGAQVPAAWEHWPTWAPVQVPPTDAPRLVGVVVPPRMLAAPGDWRDVRVIDAQGREMPFVLRARLGGRTAEWRSVRLLDASVSRGQSAEAILDTGAESRVHNAVRLHINGGTDVLTWVEVASSGDAKTWHVLRERAPIYALVRAGLGESMDVSHPDSTERYLRVRLLDASMPYRVDRAEVTFEIVTAAELVPAGIDLVSAPPSPQLSIWLSNPDAPRLPIGEVRFETTVDAFNRPVSVDVSEDGEHWRHLASGQILRMLEAGQPRASLSLTVPETRARQWRVTVYDGDNSAIADLRPMLYTTPRRVVFRQEPGQQYRVIAGNARAQPPQYDMIRLVGVDAQDAAAPATLGAPQPNAAYVDPAPWTDRHPAVLWIALAAAMAVIGRLAIRALRADPPPV